MRFRKRIQIAPGVKLNISKSGVSTTFGGKGASVSIGKRGTFANYGIPGTGLYDRKKIGGKSRSSAKKQVQRKNAAVSTPSMGNMPIEMVYNEDGSIDFYFEGELITDRSIISAIKKKPEFQMEIERLNQVRFDQIRQIDESYTAIQSSAVRIPVCPDEARKRIRCTVLKARQYEELPPDDVLMQEAKNSINTLKIWQKKAMCEEYVAQRKAQYLEDKATFEENERRYVDEQNEIFRQEYEQALREFDAIMAGDEDLLDERIVSWLSGVRFPFDFDLEFDVQGDRMLLDLDLPEIEDMPTEKAVRMASGIVKIKNKTKAEMKKEYSDCVFGLLIYIASHVFNIAVNINSIVLSAYTQRRDKEGRINDVYIVSVLFDRPTFAKLSYDTPARDNCMLFENACKQNADLGFRKIVPFD